MARNIFIEPDCDAFQSQELVLANHLQIKTLVHFYVILIKVGGLWIP